jgi:NTE family protein
MNTPQYTSDRALVLGGGGSTGNAWLIGVMAGLLDAGIDVRDADLVVGTSAGATAAAQVTAASPADLFDAIREAPTPSPPGPPGPGRSGPTAADHLERLRVLIAASAGPADLRRAVGAAALARAQADTAWQERWRATVAARLPSPHWPDQTMFLTAVDARTGEPVVFDRHANIDLVDAVAASCASGVAYAIGDRHYIDGGYRGNAENADLAAGYRRVLVLSPLGGRSLHPPEWGTHLATQVEELLAQGSTVHTIVPDENSEYLFGASAMDATLRPAAARAGHNQGRALAGTIARLWR